MTKYIQHPDGGVQSMDDDVQTPEGCIEISADEARKAFPPLFGLDEAPAAKNSKGKASHSEAGE